MNTLASLTTLALEHPQTRSEWCRRTAELHLALAAEAPTEHEAEHERELAAMAAANAGGAR